MGEAKRRRQDKDRLRWPQSDRVRSVIDLYALPPVAAVNGARIQELTGDKTISAQTEIVLRAFKAVAGNRTFHVGFCIGDGEKFSAIGIAVIERLAIEVPKTTLHIVPISHEDIAWDIVLRHLRTFMGPVLLFAFANSDVYDAGTAEISYSEHVRQFHADGLELLRLSHATREKIRAQKAEILDRPRPPTFYEATSAAQEQAPWVFRVTTPAGKVIHTAVWNGRRDYAHEPPTNIAQWVGGNKIAMVQVDSPVGVNRRSSLDLTHRLSTDFDGIIHWARDTETFHSILKSFIRLDLESASPPMLPEGWDPEITIFPANG